MHVSDSESIMVSEQGQGRVSAMTHSLRLLVRSRLCVSDHMVVVKFRISGRGLSGRARTLNLRTPTPTQTTGRGVIHGCAAKAVLRVVS